VVFERISFYFHFIHSDVRIKQDVSFRYQNELKIRPKKRIGFVHVDITLPIYPFGFIFISYTLLKKRSGDFVKYSYGAGLGAILT
jgi:hypothetical protein